MSVKIPIKLLTDITKLIKRINKVKCKVIMTIE